MNTNKNTNNSNKNTNGLRSVPSLKMFHANSKGTGAAIQFELKPAFGYEDGAVYCRLALQNPTDTSTSFATFDWKNAIITKFDFTDICKFLQVFHGECESIDEGKGLIHVSSKFETNITLTHVLEPVTSYRLSISQKDLKSGDERIGIFAFSTCEALGLSECFAGSLSQIAFGTAFEATSNALAREDEVVKQAVDIASSEAANDSVEDDQPFDGKKFDELTAGLSKKDKEACEKAVAKVGAVGMLCAHYGNENADYIQEAVDRACGDTTDGEEGISFDERKMAKAVLGENHPIWKFVK